MVNKRFECKRIFQVLLHNPLSPCMPISLLTTPSLIGKLYSVIRTSKSEKINCCSLLVKYNKNIHTGSSIYKICRKPKSVSIYTGRPRQFYPSVQDRYQPKGMPWAFEISGTQTSYLRTST